MRGERRTDSKSHVCTRNHAVPSSSSGWDEALKVFGMCESGSKLQPITQLFNNTGRDLQHG